MRFIFEAIRVSAVAWVCANIMLITAPDNQYVWAYWMISAILVICSLVAGIITMLTNKDPYILVS